MKSNHPFWHGLERKAIHSSKLKIRRNKIRYFLDNRMSFHKALPPPLPCSSGGTRALRTSAELYDGDWKAIKKLLSL